MVQVDPNERIDQIGPNTKIIQNDDFFASSLDSILLANFANEKFSKNNDKTPVIVDLGSGTGAVGLLFANKTNGKITMIEIQEQLAQISQRSVELNGLSERITVINDDMLNLFNYVNPNTIDIILTNPPFFPINKDDSRMSSDEHKLIARHEVKINLKQIISLTQRGLRNNGKLYMVHRPERLSEIMVAISRTSLVIKRLQFIRGKQDLPANMVLVEAIKGAKEGLSVLPEIVAYDSNDKITEEIQRIYDGR